MELWQPFNPNPFGLLVGDCTVRSICAVTGLDWDAVHEAQCRLFELVQNLHQLNFCM